MPYRGLRNALLLDIRLGAFQVLQNDLLHHALHQPLEGSHELAEQAARAGSHSHGKSAATALRFDTQCIVHIVTRGIAIGRVVVRGRFAS